MPLKASEIEFFKKKLEEMRDRLNQQVKGTSDSFAEERRAFEEGGEDASHKMSLEVSGKELVVLRQIGRALEKIEENTYGICDLTGEEIVKARLEAVPYAVTTVKAQEKLEKGLL